MEKRYYYKKDGKAAYNIKEPLSNILADTTGYVEITEQEWNELTAPVQPTQEQIAKQEREMQIVSHKQYLRDTDYVIIKIAECDNAEDANAIRTEYADVIAERQRVRALINELEAE